MEGEFTQAIQNRQKVRLTFYSEHDWGLATHKCAPIYYGSDRGAFDDAPRFHFWDYEGEEESKILSLSREKIVFMEPVLENFDPKEFVIPDTKNSH